MNIRELNKIENIVYFTREQLKTVFPGASEDLVKQNLYRWAKKGDIFPLKGGVYITKRSFEKFGSSVSFREYLASIIKRPSYLSLEYILRKYEILTEATFGLTSVTLKTGDTFENKLGTFSYRKIKKDLYTGYFTAYFANNEYFVATKAKALFDWLYYKVPAMASDLTGRNSVEEWRLNLEDFGNKDWEEFEKYCNLSGNLKINQVAENIIKNAPNSV